MKKVEGKRGKRESSYFPSFPAFPVRFGLDDDKVCRRQGQIGTEQGDLD